MLDTNCINARGQDLALNQLEKWSDEGRLDIIMCRTSHEESYSDGNVARFRKATQYPYSETAADTDEECWQLREIERPYFLPARQPRGRRMTSKSSSTR